MAMSSFQLFLNQVQSAPEDLKVKVLQVIFDILMVYEVELLRKSKDVADRIVTFLLQTLEVEESNAVQALLCIGISKLMINGLITDERVLTSLVLAYVSPVTSDNEELRQCLAYFLPVYCYSLPSNQNRMRAVRVSISVVSDWTSFLTPLQIFFTAFGLVSKVYEELNGDQEMITPLQFGNLFVDWTNPLKAAPNENSDSSVHEVHVDLAIELVKALHDKDRSDNDIKVFCQLLVKLYIPDDPEPLGLLCLGTLLEHLNEDVEDPATAKILARFKARFQKQFGRHLERIKDEVGKYASSEEYKEVCEVVGIDVPEGDEEDAEDGEPVWRAQDAGADVEDPRRSRSRSMTGVRERLEDNEDDDDGSVKSRSAPASRSPTPSPSHKKSRVSSAAAVDSDRSSTPLESPPTTPRRKQQASKRVRSPFRSPTTASPARKRVNNMPTPRKSRLSKANPTDPFLDSTNGQAPARKGRPHTRPQRAQDSGEDEDSGEEEQEEGGGVEEELDGSEPPSDDDNEPDDPPPARPRKRPVEKAPVVTKTTPARRSAAPTPGFDSSSEP